MKLILHNISNNEKIKNLTKLNLHDTSHIVKDLLLSMTSKNIHTYLKKEHILEIN